jgi:hypothetical protein
LLDVTEARVVKNTARVRGALVELDSATFDVLAQFERSSGVRVVLGFERESKDAHWQLRSFKLIEPMPRAESDSPTPPIPPTTPAHPALPALHDAGVAPHDAAKR